jgi:HAD superfamily hydrolase (TIGR01509 family)
MGSDNLLPIAARVDADSPTGRAIAGRKKELFAERLPELVPTPGARALVAALCDAHITIVLATCADHEEMDALLQPALVADLIPRRSSKDDAAKTKPDPDIVTAALSRAHVRAQDAVMIGDTPYDIEAARRAGVAAIALRCGGYWTDDDFDDGRDKATKTMAAIPA